MSNNTPGEIIVTLKLQWHSYSYSYIIYSLHSSEGNDSDDEEVDKVTLMKQSLLMKQFSSNLGLL